MADKRRAQLNQLLAEAKTRQDKVKAIFAKSDAEGRMETDDEVVQIKALNLEAKGFMEKAAELKDLLGIQAEIATTQDAAAQPAGGAGHGQGDPNAQQKLMLSRGNKFLEDDNVKAWLKGLGNMIISGQRVDSPRVEVQSFLKTLITEATQTAYSGGTSAGTLVFPDFKPIVDAHYQRPLTVRDMITIGQTESDIVEFVRITGVTNAAAGVGESANITDGDTSGKKPESAMAFATVSANVQSIAHWIPATSRALQDAGQLRTYIDQFLQYGIQEQLEDDILQGNGSNTFTGIFNTSGINFQSFSTDVLTTSRKARTLVSTQGRARPTAFLMHPLDWEAIDLAKDSQGRYYFGGPMALGTKTLWGLPVVESEGCTQGEALVGDFKLAILWDRMQSAVSISNSHNDFFIRNMVAILAEMRAAFGVVRPSAFTQFETVSGGS